VKAVVRIDYRINEHEEWENEELFDDIERALEFYEQLDGSRVDFDGATDIQISLTRANPDNLYHEDDGSLNYEDNSTLYTDK